MSKHDSWIRDESPRLHPIARLFPEGFPVRDPFPMGILTGRNVLWILDINRLSAEQKEAFIKLTAEESGQSYHECLEQVEAGSLIGLPHNNCISLSAGPEGFCRMMELITFNHFHKPDDPDILDVYNQFAESQIKRWIDGSQKPDVEAAYQSLPDELKTKEAEYLYRRFMEEERLGIAGFSVFDVLMGKSTSELLNELDSVDESNLTTDWEMTDIDLN